MLVAGGQQQRVQDSDPASFAERIRLAELASYGIESLPDGRLHLQIPRPAETEEQRQVLFARYLVFGMPQTEGGIIGGGSFG